MKVAPVQRFSDTLYSLRKHQGARVVSIAIAVASTVLLLLAMSWMLLARVPVFVQLDATVRSIDDPYSLLAQVEGELAGRYVSLGDTVQKGQLLFEIDVGLVKQQLDVAENVLRFRRKDLASVEKRLSVLEVEVEAINENKRYSQEEVRAQLREKVIANRIANEKLARLRALEESSPVAPKELFDAKQEVEMSEAVLDAWQARMRAGATQSDAQRALEQQEFEIKKQLSSARADLEAQNERVAQLQHEVSQHRVESPVRGRVIEVYEGNAGATVTIGTLIAKIEPAAELVVLAEGAAKGAGRVQLGQSAWVELASYPSARFGRLRATAIEVIKSPTSDEVVATLRIQEGSSHEIPVASGDRGTAFIEVEHAPPIAMLLEQR